MVNYPCHRQVREDDEPNMAAVRTSCRALGPWLGPGVYGNKFNADEYDPGNLFRVNHNIAR